MLISDDVVEFVLVYGISLPQKHVVVSDKTHRMSPGGRIFLWMRCAMFDDSLLS